jgi:hypothetical protein
MVKNWHGFDFVQKNKDTLVVTIGDSWTWGDSLGKTKNYIYDDKEFRLANVYGGQLADRLQADFLNIAKIGGSNLWITDHFCMFINQLTEFDYKKIIVVITLTEVGREFQGDRDRQRDYISDLKLVTDLNAFLSQLSKYIENTIMQTNNNKIQLIVGTNFVDSNYTFPVLEKSWVDVIADRLNVEIIKPCYVVGSWVFDRFDTLLTFTPNYSKENFLKDAIAHMEMASTRTDFLLASRYNYKTGSKHPTPEGHALWANYIFEKINDK